MSDFLLVLGACAGVVLLAWLVRDTLRRNLLEDTAQPRDPVLRVDAFTEERRRHLAEMQRPATKGIEARRHTVLDLAARRKAMRQCEDRRQS